MGSSTSCGIVPFKLELDGNAWNWDVSHDNPKLPKWLYNLYFGYDGVLRDEIDDNIDIGNGWMYHPDPFEEYDDLYLTPIKKDKFTVYSINESQYSCGGGIEPSIVALDKKSLEVFKKDFDIKDKILTNKKTYQTI